MVILDTVLGGSSVNFLELRKFSTFFFRAFELKFSIKNSRFVFGGEGPGRRVSSCWKNILDFWLKKKWTPVRTKNSKPVVAPALIRQLKKNSNRSTIQHFNREYKKACNQGLRWERVTTWPYCMHTKCFPVSIDRAKLYTYYDIWLLAGRQAEWLTGWQRGTIYTTARVSTTPHWYHH